MPKYADLLRTHLVRKVNDEMRSKCLSVANKVGMLIGDLTFRNVIQVLEDAEYPTMIPVGISIHRFAAMVIASQHSQGCC